MTASLVLSIVAMAISIITFVITVYEQYFKNAKLQLILGRQLRFSYGQGHADLAFWASIALANQGAVDAVVLDVSGELTGSDGWSAPVRWRAFGDFAPGTDGPSGGDPQFVFKGWTETLVASSRRATTSWVAFSVAPLPEGSGGSGSDGGGSTGAGSGSSASGSGASGGTPLPMKAGVEYTLSLDVMVPDRRVPLMSGAPGRRDTQERRAMTWTGRFTLDQQDVTFLEASCVADAGGFVKDMLTVEVTGAARWLSRRSATATVTDRRPINRVSAPW